MFSVIIPVYNHARFLREAVASALASDLVKEVLLCDDGSKDDSAALCAQLANENPKRVWDFSEQPSRNRGAHNRLNQLCRHATQPWLRVLNSDDFFLPGSFETLRLLAAIHRATCISGSMLICDELGKILGTKKGVFDPEYPLPQAIEAKSVYKNDEVRQLLLNQNFIATTSNMAFTRELFDKIGGFADFRYAHDLDFALRATMHGNAIHSSAFLVTYRIHGTNTISEVSPHMDGEITRLYANFLDDYSRIESASKSYDYLYGNKHIEPFPCSPKIEISWSSNSLESGLSLSPRLPASSLPNVLLALGAMDYDFVLVSKALYEPPLASIDSLQDTLGAIGGSTILTSTSGQSLGLASGRLLRCAPKDKCGYVSNLADILDSQAAIEGSDIHLRGRRKPKIKLRTDILELLRKKLGVQDSDQRPVMFVLPIFLAVGGVERNTIEVIRKLRDSYRFVVITTEYLSEKQGSLHWQLEEMEVPIFDLAEIAGQEHHLDLLAILAELLPPNLIWICNGSPWLVENSIRFRRLFANVPILDQQVYDTVAGWIAHYDKKGIQSFDHFIAINSKIRSKFIAEIKIPAHRVSLIYPALNEEPVVSARRLKSSRVAARRELGIPDSFDKIFIFVGRLTDQKKPLSFLEIVRDAEENHPNACFLMVGDGELAADCDRFIEEHRLNNIRRISYHPRPPELMALADGMIITSIFEGLPIAMLEALAVGIPVLATDVGDIRLVLEEYTSGLVSRATDLHGKPSIQLELWKEFMNRLPALQTAAESSFEKILNRFGTVNISTQYDAIFQKAYFDANPTCN